MSENIIVSAPLDARQIMEILPHRPPFLLVDRIVELQDNIIIGEKCVTINEPFFQGHFPGFPVMPGVLILEAMAQIGAVHALSREHNRGRIAFLAGVDDARFRRAVVPGDLLRIEMINIHQRRNAGKSSGQAFVGDKLAAEAVLTFTIGDK
ncbi:MAG: 3-hydroxyacyl-ACP dehydratase FabZ [bacterium]|nr:3-hydroxyacyl-ACP dehydratase FabZ [Candidatus Sumerlaeota bacterium]